MILYKCDQNPLRQLLKQFSKLYQLWGPVTWPALEGWYTRNIWFSRFLEYISASFWYFFMKSFLVVRSYRVLVINIKILIMGALVTPWKEAQSPDSGRFLRFLAFFELFFSAQVFSLAQWFFHKKNGSMYVLSLVIFFFMILSPEPIINTMQTGFL